jgi:hypothetical protein
MEPIRWTQERYDALMDAYGQGVTRVKYSDKEVEYRSLAEMRSLLDEAEAELFGVRPVRVTVAHYVNPNIYTR